MTSKAGNDGLVSISSEMQITPAERSEPGDSVLTITRDGLEEVVSISKRCK